MISRRVKISGVTVVCAVMAISSLGCRNGGRGIDFTPKFAFPKLKLPSFPARLRPGTAQESEMTCGCEACQQQAANPYANESAYGNGQCPTCPSANQATPFTGQLEPETSNPLKAYEIPAPQENALPLYPTPVETPKLPAPEAKELFIVPEAGQSEQKANDDNSFEVRGKQPFRKTVTSPLQKALTSTKKEMQLQWKDESANFKPVEMAEKAESLKSQLDSAMLQNDLEHLAMGQPKELMEPATPVAPAVPVAPPAPTTPVIPVEKMVDDIVETVEPQPAPAEMVEPKYIPEPAPLAAPETVAEAAPMPEPEPAPELPAAPVIPPTAQPELAVAPVPVTPPAPVPPAPTPVAPPAPAPVAVRVPTPTIEVQAAEEIYGAILFDKRIEENLRAEKRFSAQAPSLPAEIELPEEPWKIELLETPPQDVIQIKRPAAPKQKETQKQASSDMVVLRAYSSERSNRPMRQASRMPVRSVSTATATAPASVPKAAGNIDFIIQSLPTPPTEEDASEYQFQSVPQYQAPVLRAKPPADDDMTRFKIRVQEPSPQAVTDSCKYCDVKFETPEPLTEANSLEPKARQARIPFPSTLR